MHDIRPIRAKSGTNQEGASAHNRRVIIEALRLNGALSRADLARATLLTKQTVSNLMEALEQDGLVVGDEVVRKGRGQPSTPYRLVAEGAFAIGVQIDRHVTRAIAVDLLGNVRSRAERPLPSDGPASGVRVILDLVATMRRDLAGSASCSEQRLAGLGVAMPGPFGIETAENDDWMMASWQMFPLMETLSAGTGLEVGLQNDAAACATAERMVGAAHGLENAVCIYLGYGIGAGLILNGELYAGAHGNAGELGMALFCEAGGQPAPVEHRASLASLYKRLDLDPAHIDLQAETAALLERKDPRIEGWIIEAAESLRWSVHLLETLFDPQTVILSGGAPAALLHRLMERILPLLPSNAIRRDRVLPRLTVGMTDPWAVALGAAAEPISRAFDPRFGAMLKE